MTDPRGVEVALAHPDKSEINIHPRCIRPGQNWFQNLEENPAIPRQEQLSIYAEAYFARILESLEDDFPTLRKVLGEESFVKLIADYLKNHPSRYATIGEIGKNLPQFLKTYEMTKAYPFVAEIAQLEWQLICAFFSRSHLALNLDEYSSVGMDAWAQARFSLSESVHLLQLHWPVDQLWECKNKDDFDGMLSEFAERETFILIHQNAQGVCVVKSISSPEYQILGQVLQNVALGKICEMIQDSIEVAEIMGWFGTWIREGVIQKINFEEFT